MRDVLIHVHGVGGIDFSSMSVADLDEVENLLRKRECDVVPTVFLRREYMLEFLDVLEHYTAAPVDRYPSIRGFAVEGPMLGSHGGVPASGCWSPSSGEWRTIAAMGDVGLQYMVIGPDAVDLDESVDGEFSFRDIIDELYSHGVKLALGHFVRNDPVESARRTQAVIDYVQQTYGPCPDALITDHLFNDMPRLFVHAWRTAEECVRRTDELARFLAQPWTEDTIDEVLGPVPGTLLRAALNDQLVPALNFDGDHVDLAICQRVVKFLGAGRLLAITDHTECDTMADEDLHRREGSSLLYRRDGLVAAGSRGLSEQRRNMASIGMSAGEIDDVLQNVPSRVLEHRVGPRAVGIGTRTSWGEP